MAKHFFIFLFSLMNIVFISAQSLTIMGRFIDEEDQSPICDVTIIVFTADSAYLTSTTSSNGKFQVKSLNQGSYVVSGSLIGYQPITVEVNGLSTNYDIGDIYMKKNAFIDEIVVTANTHYYNVDKQVIIVTPSLREKSRDAFDVLYNLSLPDLQYNIAEKSISTLRNGSLQLRVDGVIQPISYLSSLHSEDVLSIEYIDRPGIRYGDGVTSVLNVKTRRRDSGYQLGFNTTDALTSPFTRNTFSTKHFTRKDIFTLIGGLNYSCTKSVYSNSHKDFYFPNEIKTIERVGVPINNKNYSFYTTAGYNHTFNPNLMLNTSLNYSYQHNPAWRSGHQVFESGGTQYQEMNIAKDKSHNWAFDVYLDWKIREDENLLFNIRGTSVSSNYMRDYLINNLSDYVYNVDGERKSLIAELIYDNKIGESHVFSTGGRSFIANTDNLYLSSSVDAFSFMKTRDMYIFTEIKGEVLKVNYSVGGGLSVESFKNGDQEKSYVFFRPSVSLHYPFNSKLRLSYALGINPVKPTLSNLTDIRQQINIYEVVEGNSFMDSYQTYMNNFVLNYYTNSTVISLVSYLQYNHNPMMAEPIRYEEDENGNGLFISSFGNQKSFIHGQMRLYANQKFLQNKLSLVASGAMNRYINNGNEYVTTLSAFLFYGSVSFNEKNWGMTVNYTSPIKTRFGQTTSIQAQRIQADVYYRLKNCSVGIGVQNPFFDGYQSLIELNGGLVNSVTENFMKSNNNRIYLTFSWNFQSGKSRTYQKKLNNLDNETGIFK